MLTKRVVAVLLLSIAGAMTTSQLAHAKPLECKKYSSRGLCIIWASTPSTGSNGTGSTGSTGTGSTGSTGTGSDGTGSTGSNPASTSLTIKGIPCTYAGLASPQPRVSDPVWEGHTTGAIQLCIATNGRFGTPVRLLFWAAAPPAGAAAPPDPAQLAQQAMAAMQLKAINVGIVPEPKVGSVGIIGMPTWMWAENPGPSTIGPITKSASAGGFTVTATAHVKQIVWRMGDGATVTCQGAGTPYADSFGRSSSPDCGHTYTRTGRYAVQATSYWVVDWAGIGQSGQIPIDFTQATAITMGEVQVLTQ